MAKSPEPGTAQAPPARAGLVSEAFSSFFVFDNPSLGRALRYTFADKRLGRAVFMNALFLVIALAAVNELFGSGGLGLLSDKLSFGRAAFLATAIVETIVASLLGPISFAQLFNAERREDCFDQVVATGCSPLRILLGRYAAALAFVAVVVISALPFFVFSAFVLSGAEASEIAIFYVVIGLYAASICAAVLATTVAIEDAAFPIVFAFVFTLVAVVAGLSPKAPPALAAWSPFRHIATSLGQDVGIGDIAKPFLYGTGLPTSLVSCGGYLTLILLSLAYVCVGPDLEFSEGLDSFSSVTLKRGGEASRGRRGLASTLLRVLQLRFLYENLSPGMRRLGPFLRLSATVVLYAASHVIALGVLWPRVPPRGWYDLEDHTTLDYLGFCALSLGLISLSSAGARAAVLARVPVLSIGPIKVGRFPALFFIVLLALAIPPLLFGAAARASGLELAGPDMTRALELYGLVALYAVFMFALALTVAMLTRNPYSSMGTTLAILIFLNLLPLGWIPLFASNLATEETAHVLDVNPVFAGIAIERPDFTFPFGTTRDEQQVKYEHAPSWKPYVFVHAPLAILLLAIGLALERRDARGRKFLGALSLALACLLVPKDAFAQGNPAPAPAPFRVELDLGLGGKVPIEGFTPLVANVENASGADAKIVVAIKDSQSGATLARLGPAEVPRGTTRRMSGLAAAEPLCESSGLVVEAQAENGQVLYQGTARSDPLRTDRLLVVVDKRGALPFAVAKGALRTYELADPARVHPAWRGAGIQHGRLGNWTMSYVSDALGLPSSAQGWTGAGAVVLGDLEPRSWSPLAARALAGWLARGGDLVLVVGDRAKSIRESSLGEALGDAIGSLPPEPPRRQVGLAPIFDLVLGKGAGAGLEPASAVAHLSPGPRDTVLLRDDDGEPLLLRRRCGLGRLTIVACDIWQPPLLHQEGASRLLEELLSLGPRYGPRAEILFTELSELHVQPARIGPAFGALLLYALLVGPGIYFALRPKKKGLLAWVLIPAFAVLASLLVPLYKIVLANADSAIVTASLIETASDDPWEVETADGLVVSGGLERHEVFIPGKDVIAASIPAPRRAFRESGAFLGIPLGDPSSKTGLTFSLDIPLWGARYVTSERLLANERPRISGRIALRSTGPWLELKNQGRQALEDMIVVYPRFQGGIAAWEHEIEAPLAEGTPVSLPLGGRLAGQSTPAGKVARDLAQSLERKLASTRAKSRVEEGRRPQEAVLLARVAEPRTTIDAGPHARVRASATVLFARIPFVFEEQVPPGASNVARSVETAPVDSSQPAAQDKVVYMAETRIQIPPGAGAGKPPRRAWIDVAPNGTPMTRVVLSVREGPEGSWRKLDASRAVKESSTDPRDPREPHFSVEVSSPERILDGQGVVSVRQTLELPPDAKPDQACADIDVRLEWGGGER